MFIKPKHITIKTLEELKELTKRQPAECSLCLQGGLFTRKTISRKGEYWTVVNHIDGSRNYRMTDKQLGEFTLIPKAIKKGALVLG